MKLPINYDDTHWKQRKLVREEYVIRQDGKCYHCKESLTGNPSNDILDAEIHPGLFPKGFFNHPVHLHHNHDTGMTIGAVHNFCNAVLWEHHGE